VVQVYNSLDDDLAEIVRERIIKAEKRVYACLYILSYPYITQSLLLAKRSGCDVRVILSDDPLNTDTASYLEANKIPVKILRKSRGILHTKILICDDTALVGSFNPTYMASTHNIEIMLEITEKKMVNDLTSFFLRLWRM
jgi:phosphatidylserine/phosphatidylglycerophosphate/cardiolipin synthase-like enzyme